MRTTKGLQRETLAIELENSRRMAVGESLFLSDLFLKMDNNL
jgi:hypothetical protein